MKIWTLLWTFSFPGLVICLEAANRDEDHANFLIESFNQQAMEEKNMIAQKEWAAYTDSTAVNWEALANQTSLKAQFDKEMRTALMTLNSSALSKDMQRQLKKMMNIGTSAETNHTKVTELVNVINEMTFINTNAFETAGVSPELKPENCTTTTVCHDVEPDNNSSYVFECTTTDSCLEMDSVPQPFNNSNKVDDPSFSVTQTSQINVLSDEDNMKFGWVHWRNETGRKIRNLYTKFVQLSNEAVQNLGYRDAGEQWRSAYESDTFVDDVQELWNQVRPLYEQLHAYVRRQLKQVYGESLFPASGHIPAHILRNTWSPIWDSLADLVKPFPNKTTIDVTAEMRRQNYTVDKMFRTAENFFVSLGFERMPASFWKSSMLEYPRDGRKPACVPAAFDFFNASDFRIAMCTDISQDELIVAYHEMGHIVYDMQYKDQPIFYRDGANPAFHEAVGDVMALSFQTPEHLKKLGLIQEIPTDNESDINFLMNMALQKVASLPYTYILDKWRWSAFSGQTTPATYNADWWKLRCQVEGASPPVARSEDDFDVGAKFHVAAGVPYIRYFLSIIIQFQFHQAACKAAGNLGPLHRCDIYNEVKAGDKLRAMLKLGSSKPWPEAMKQLTGQEKMSAAPLLEYFKPLYDFLRKENGNDYGWEPDCSVPT